MIVLSKRLLAAASLVDPGSSVADVGTDHGFLPIYLVEQKKAVRALAMDIRTGPLSRAKEHIREAGLEGRIETRLGSGPEKLKPGEADTVVIAGMGGPLILEILKAGAHVVPSIKNFILSPQSDWRGFRQGIRDLNLCIVREKMIDEDGKYYLILKAVHSAANAVREPDTELSLRFGSVLLKEKDPVLRDYLIWQEGILTGILHKLTEGSTPAAGRRREKVEQELKEVRDALLICGRSAGRE